MLTRKTFLFLVILWLTTNVATAQTASLMGRVTDAQDAGVVGATVTVTTSLAEPVVTTTDSTGKYQFEFLDPGRYTVIVTMPGFSVAELAGVTVEPDTTKSLDVRLVVARFEQQVDVVGVTPAPAGGVGRDRIPASISVITASELEDRYVPSLADALHERLGAVTLDNSTTNLFQPTLRLRGFTASPLLGLPQGVAIYQNGVRINEPFGDTVQFDLIPHFALAEAQVSTGSEPTFGLNALGGAVSLRLKNGFDHDEFRGEVLTGSFNRFSGTAEWGIHSETWALYLGATHFDEAGWRVASPSEVTQAIADVGYRKGRVDAGITFTYADSSLNGNAPAPIELLAADRSAVFTYPDTTENRLAFGQARLQVAVSSAWTVQLTGYYRDLDRRTLNGDEAEFGRCSTDSIPFSAPQNTLCFGAEDDDDDDERIVVGDLEDDDDDDDEEHPLVDVNTGRFITGDDAQGNAAFNRTRTLAKGYGAQLQASATGDLDGRENVFSMGLSLDLADIDFSSNSEVGTLTPERSVAGSGLFAGLLGSAPDDLFNTGIDTANQLFGLYFSDTLSLTNRAHVTVSGRFNHASIEIFDRLGVSLNGQHSFSRFNMGMGGVYEISDAVSVFGRYSESNRAPTAAELSCADPAEPCRVPNAFVSDPPLEQVVARSVEVGFRGPSLSNSGNGVSWSVAFYRTAIGNDILFVASPDLIGTGFFKNAGGTSRVGLDAELYGQVDRVSWFASYGLVEATFQTGFQLASHEEVNDAADEDGMINVEVGDLMPGIPRQNLKAGFNYTVTDTWDVALDMIATSSRFYVGDEGNDQRPLDGYGIANFRSVYRVSDNIEIFARIDNLLNNHYSTFGVLAELEVFLSEVPDAQDQRFVSPGTARSGFVGLRIGL